jgi:hypothetical protein
MDLEKIVAPGQGYFGQVLAFSDNLPQRPHVPQHVKRPEFASQGVDLRGYTGKI